MCLASSSDSIGSGRGGCSGGFDEGNIEGAGTDVAVVWAGCLDALREGSEVAVVGYARTSRDRYQHGHRRRR